MRCTVSKHTDWNYDISYWIVTHITHDVEWVAFPDIPDNKIEEIKMLKSDVQKELNRILSSYINL